MPEKRAFAPHGTVGHRRAQGLASLASLAALTAVSPLSAQESTAQPVVPPVTSPAQPAVVGAPSPPPAGYYAPGYYVPAVIPVVLQADRPGMVVELYTPSGKADRDAPLVRCQTPCVAQVPPASYRVQVRETEDTLGGGRVVSLSGPSYVTVTPDEPSERWIGLGLGVGGTVAIPAGIVLIVSEAIDDMDCIDETRCQDDVNLVAPGLLLVLGGLVATPIGWVMFAQSFKPSVTIQPGQFMQPVGALPIHVRVGGPRGSAGLGLGATF